MKKILLLTDFSSGYSRDLLRGVVEYAKDNGPWIFYRLPLYYREIHGDKGISMWAEQWEADAIIAQLSDIDLDTLMDLNIPIIVQNYADRKEMISNITGDYFGTGVMAAEFFIHRGYKKFAYYGFDDAIWMRERGDGCRHEVKKHGLDVYFYNDSTQIVGESGKWEFDANKVKDWLLALPKPIALFACDDFFALQLTEICKMYEINIPEDIAILGVDNDELLCNISDPTLTSVELDVVSGGYEVGTLLDKYFKGEMKAPLSTDIIVKPIKIVLRQSTEKFQVSDKYVEQALKLIELEYYKELTIEQILQKVPLSRRVFERRFKKETFMTIYKYIQEVRVERFANLLQTTEIPLTEAAFMSGFSDYKNVSRIFSKKKLMTPSQYRDKFRKDEKKNDAF
jgi:LacI family transcriptional regulator